MEDPLSLDLPYPDFMKVPEDSASIYQPFDDRAILIMTKEV